MAYFVGNPGRGAYEQAAIRIAVVVLAASITAAGIVLGFSLVARLGGGWIALTAAVVALEIAYFRRDLRMALELYRDGRNWWRGAEGETKVHAELQRLSSDFIVFHDYHFSNADGHERWNLDHIVVGPSGVFVVETKHYSRKRIGAVSKDPQAKANAEQAQREAMALKNRLEKWSSGALTNVFVVPVLVYAQDGAYLKQLRAGATRTIPLKFLIGEIERHTENALDPDRAGRIARVLYEQMAVGDREPFGDELLGFGRHMRQLAGRDAGGVAVRPTAAIPVAAATEKKPVCPKCGSELVRRTARKGSNAGNTFLACPRYPECRHTEPIRA